MIEISFSHNFWFWLWLWSEEKLVGRKCVHFLQFVHWLKYLTVHLVGFQRSNWNWHFVQESVTSSPVSFLCNFSAYCSIWSIGVVLNQCSCRSNMSVPRCDTWQWCWSCHDDFLDDLTIDGFTSLCGNPKF